MKLFTRFLIILLVFALTPVLAMGVWLMKSNISAQENAVQYHQQVVRLFSDIVEQSVSELNRSLSFVEDLDHLEVSNSNQAFKVVQRAMAEHPLFVLVSMTDSSGMETTRVSDARLYPGEGYVSRAKDPLLAEALKTDKISIGMVEIKNNRPLMPLVYPLSEGRCVYIVADLHNLWRRVQAHRLGLTGRLVLLDAKGRPMAGFAEDLLPRDWDSKDILSDSSGWSEHMRTLSGMMVGAFVQTPSLGWWILSLEPRDEAFTGAGNLAAEVFAFMVLLMVLAALAAAWMGWQLSRPLQALVEGAQRAARGEFDQTVPEGGWSELRRLTANFNSMMLVLQSYKEMNLENILEEKAKVEALANNIPDGIVFASFEGQVLYMNATARLLLGAPDTMTPHKIPSIQTLFREPALREIASELLKHKKHAAQAEVELKNVQGATQGVYLCRGTTVIHGKREVGVLLILRDITVQRNLERMKEEFLHSIVHDLKNPLSSIDGFIQLILERASSMTESSLRTYLGYIQESLNQQRQLVSDILDSAKIESGTMHLKLEPLNILQMVEQLKGMFIIQGERRGVEVRFDQIPQAPVPLYCDVELTQRVVMNLIGNALKFTPRGGRISLSISPANGEVQFAVSDTGLGIPQDKLEVIFEKFKQLDGPAQRSGYGLGLSICKKIVELHGGRIWAESKQGEGSRFIFLLPLKPVADPSKQVSPVGQ